MRFNYGKFKPRRAAGPGELLSADAARCGGALRSGSVRRRHPEHAPDDARRGIQLLEGGEAEPGQRAARRLRQDRAVHVQSDYGHDSAQSLGINGININDITTGLPNINITNFTGISGGPAFLPVNPSQFHYQIEDALVWLRGPSSIEVRLSARRPPALAVDPDNTRSTIDFGTSFVNNPVTNTRRYRPRRGVARQFQLGSPRLSAGAVYLQRDRARHVRAGRFQGEQPVDYQCGGAIRDLQGADRGGQPPREFRFRDVPSGLCR